MAFSLPRSDLGKTVVSVCTRQKAVKDGLHKQATPAPAASIQTAASFAPSNGRVVSPAIEGDPALLKHRPAEFEGLPSN